MNRRLLIRMTAPSVLIGLVLLATCLVSVWSINRLQRNLAHVLSENVANLEAAQELEIQLRQLRFHSFLNVIEPRPDRAELIANAQRSFEAALRQARQTTDPEHRRLVDELQKGYQQYRANLAHPLPANPTRADLSRWSDAHPIRELDKPCRELLRLNKEAMAQTARESEEVGGQARLAMFLAGLLGPISGLIIGYGLARGLSRTIARLNVRMQDVHAHLEQDVGSLRLTADGDLRELDRQLDRVVVRVREVAETVQRQQQEMLRAEQLAAVGQLAASVAHEVRNPLTAIKMLVGAALRPRQPQPLNDGDLRVIYDEVGRLEQTVQTLLDFARPPTLHREPADLRSLVRQAQELVRVRAEQQHVTISIHAPDHPAMALVDANQLRGVIVNLLVNALDVLPQGGRIDVRVSIDHGLRVRVADSGPGIAPPALERLFTPFASTKATGTGLGLSICRRVLEQHGGAITARNPPEGGAEFTLVLPGSPEEKLNAVTAGHR
jgi:two-component system, NtrC family, sensor histidine kinase HydH